MKETGGREGEGTGIEKSCCRRFVRERIDQQLGKHGAICRAIPEFQHKGNGGRLRARAKKVL